MNRLQFVRISSVLVAAVGLSAVFGWIFDIGILKSALPNLVEMKFVTALCFIAAGIVVYSAAEERHESSFIVQAVMPAATLLILILMVTLLITSVFGVGTGIDDLFISEKPGALHTVVPGRPSMPTMINFVLIAVAGMLVSFGFKKQLFWFGCIVAVIGGIAIVGYIINQPILYYLIIGRNTAMALNTAVLFVLIGISFVLCGKMVSKQN